MEQYGHHDRPFLMIHGGAGPMDPSSEWIAQATAILVVILEAVKESLGTSGDSLDVVETALRHLESEPAFNAGIGSALQADGQARMTAALMSGIHQRFSGVIGVTQIEHPSGLARHLQGQSSRVLTQPGANALARELGAPVTQVVTAKRLEQWYARALDAATASDTVGAVVWHPEWGLAAGTSTGGRGFETPGRVSDSATVAGNYASQFAALSATGIGEEIVDDALAARLETRCRDAMSLKGASERCYQEALDRQRQYGWIACSQSGDWAVAYTTQAMSYALMDFDGRILARSGRSATI